MKKQFAVIVFKYFTTFFLPTLLVAVLPFAYAVEITHNGNVVQSDDFETGVVGNNPNDPPWKGKNGGAMDNSNLNVRIADSNPPAAQGSNYLVLDRAGNSGTDGRAYIEGFDTLDSGVVGANFSLLLPSTNSVGVTNSSEGNIGLGPNMSGGLYLGLGQKNAGGQFKIDYFDAAASTWVDSGLTYAYDTWQVWEMSVNEDTGDATLAIDGDSINFNIGRVDFGVNRLEIEGGFAGASGPPHNQIFIDAAGQPAVFSEFTWIGDNGDWNNAGNWDSPGFPDTQAHSAIFGDSIGSEQTIFSNTPVTVNSIRFNNANTHAVAGTGSFNLAATTENPPVSPTLQVDQGDHQFQAAVNLVNDTTATIASGASLSINNQLDLGGNVLTKTGDGTLSVNNALITGNGGSIANNSGVLAGVGTVGGNVDNLGGTVAPGNSPGVLTVNGNYTQGSGGTLEIEVTGTSPGESGHDQLSVTGAASLDGTLDIVPQAPYADPSVRGASENMVILTAGTVTGTFSTVNYDGNA
ncbi:MAG: hypothetical protein MK179_16225, partial [Pirellulaceae bacterium]|nr:hypothetical protein [Pirellulaceae bacterium]